MRTHTADVSRADGATRAGRRVVPDGRAGKAEKRNGKLFTKLPNKYFL